MGDEWRAQGGGRRAEWRGCPVSSAVERLPYKQDVAGSKPAPGMGRVLQALSEDLRVMGQLGLGMAKEADPVMGLVAPLRDRGLGRSSWAG